MLSVTYSPAEIAQRWGCKVDKVLSLIGSRELVAMNLATSRTAGKPRWRISPQALEDFERGRSTQPKPKPVARRRKAKSAVIEFF